MKQEVVVKIMNEESKYIWLIEVFGKASHCLLCFFQFMQRIVAEALNDIGEGVNVGVKFVKNVRFVDDQGIVAEMEIEIQNITDYLIEILEKYIHV